MKTMLLGITFLLTVMLLLVPTGVLGQVACTVPNIPGEITYPSGWFAETESYSTTDEVDPGGEVELWVDSGGWGCSPYEWTVTGTGFEFETDQGTATTVTTESDLEKVKLIADGGACGAAEITVAASCGEPFNAYVRSTSGRWTSDTHTTKCWVSAPADYCFIVGHQRQCEKIQGKYWFTQNINWAGGSACGEGFCVEGDPECEGWRSDQCIADLIICECQYWPGGGGGTCYRNKSLILREWVCQ